VRLSSYPIAAPIEEIEPHICRLWKMRKTDKEILQILQEDYIDPDKYGLGYVHPFLTLLFRLTPFYLFRINSFRKMRQQMGLERARRQKHTVQSIHEEVQALRAQFPLAGAREMVSLLFHEKEMSVPR